jgi:hypothetical protein
MRLGHLAAVVLLFEATGSEAAARDRLAVVIVADADPNLGENLTEAALSSVAEREDHVLIGARELRGRLVEVPSAPELGSCVWRPDCLSRLCAVVGARRALIGSVRRVEDGILIQLALADAHSGKAEAEWSRVVADDVPSLVSSVGTGVRSLFAATAPAQEALGPPPSPSLEALAPAVVPPALQLERKADGTLEAGHRRANARIAYAGAGALALAVIAFSGAAVTGNAAEAPLLGNTRAEMQADLDRREDYASAANILLLTGSALSLASGVLLAWWWRTGGGGGR